MPPVGRRDAEALRLAPERRGGIDEHRLVDGLQVREVRAGVAVGRESGTRVTRPERLDAAPLFLGATVLGHERAVELPVAPGDLRADRLVEAEAPPDRGDVEVDARG